MRNLARLVVIPLALTMIALARAEDAPDAVIGDAEPDATVTFIGGSVAAGIDPVWSRGGLYYAGESHEFSIAGLSLVNAGAADISGAGEVYYLQKLADFPGNYVEFGAGLAPAAGGTAAYLRNEHGVVLRIVATTAALKFNLAARGVKVDLTG